MASGGPRPVELHVADEASAWSALGFSVDQQGAVAFPGFRVVLTGRRGTVSLGLAGLAGEGCSSGDFDDIDGITVHRSGPAGESAVEHANGVAGVDHLVVRTANWQRTKAAFGALGLFPKRQSDAVRRGVVQLFFRAEGMHTPIIEVVGPLQPQKNAGGTGGAELWGLTFVSGDLNWTHEAMRECTRPPWRAVQPGRYITVLQHGRDRGVSLALAFMSPHVKEEQLSPEQREALYAQNAREQERELAERQAKGKL